MWSCSGPGRRSAHSASLCLVAAQYIITATPLVPGLPPVSVRSPTTRANVSGLVPATQYQVFVVGEKSDGTRSPASNPINIVTAAKG